VIDNGVSFISDWKKHGSGLLAHRDILIEATSSQKLWATKVSSGDQGGEPTLGL